MIHVHRALTGLHVFLASSSITGFGTRILRHIGRLIRLLYRCGQDVQLQQERNSPLFVIGAGGMDETASSGDDMRVPPNPPYPMKRRRTRRLKAKKQEKHRVFVIVANGMGETASSGESPIHSTKIYARGIHFAYTCLRLYKIWWLAGSVVSP